MELADLFQKLGISLVLGMLVGLQREYVDSPLAGIRTFPIVSVLGTVCALLAQEFGGWIVGLGVVALAAMIVVGNVAKMRAGENDPGLTTEVALLLMFSVGAYLVIGPPEIAVAIAGGLAVLLQWKEPLHGFVQKIGPSDIRAIMQFVLITLVILPVLPDDNFGPYQAFNPFRSWLMVVLIVAISLGGYIAYKLFGQKTGALLGGVLGGLISSTATTVSFSRRARSAPKTTVLAGAVILIASTVAFARVIGEIAIVAPGTISHMAPPLAVMGGWMAVLSGGLYFFARNKATGEMPPPSNPAELTSALIFGGLYAAVKLGIAAAKEYYGDQGIYAVAILSGLHDMDAITLSTAQLANSGEVELSTGWRVILAAALSNLVFKAAITAVLGQWRLFALVAALFAAAMTGGIALLILWPG